MTLLLNSAGDKMGKTASGAVWLDPNKTSPYDFYQYWRNTDDADVIKCLRMLTFLPLEEISEMENRKGSELNRAKEILAYELTSLVHGAKDADEAKETAKALFSSGGSDSMPTTELTESDFEEDRADILTLLVRSGLCPSKSDARRAVEQGGVEVNGEKITEFSKKLTRSELSGSGAVIKKGKKSFNRVVFKGNR